MKTKENELKLLLKEAKETIGMLKRSMLVHPDCTEDSEFDVMTDAAQEMDELKEILK